MTSSDGETNLYRPLTIRNVTFKHRIFVSSHSYNFSSAGSPTKDYAPYVAARLRGGASLVVLGETLVDHAFVANGYSPGPVITNASRHLYDQLAAVSDETGGHVFEQLFHPGGLVWPGRGAVALAPSPVPHDTSGSMPWELTRSELLDIRGAFERGAQVVGTSPLSGVELKADQGKLLHEFLSPRFNHRHDEYREGVNFLLETIEAIKANLREDQVLGIRLPTWDWDAATQDRWILPLLTRLDEHGLTDYVSISLGTNSTRSGYREGHGEHTFTHPTRADQIAELKQRWRRPLFIAGGIRTLGDAAAAQSAGADMIAMTRAQIADPNFVHKHRAGHLSEVIPCIRCNISCVGCGFEGLPVHCAVNPTTGREFEAVSWPRGASRPHLAIVGAGPAGLYAALASARYGAHVDIYEREDDIGGQLRFMAEIPGRQGVREYLDFLRTALDAYKHLVTVRLGQSWTGPRRETVWAGGAPIFDAEHRPPLANLEQERILPVRHILSTKNTYAGARIAVVDFAPTLSAPGIAIRLAERGADVTYLTAFDKLGGGVDYVTEYLWWRELTTYKCHVHLSTVVEVLQGTDVSLRSTLTGEISSIDKVDFVVPVGYAREVVPSGVLLSVGDCRYPRGLEYALLDSAMSFGLAY